MIQVTRLNNTKFVINAELIEMIEATPDTMISLTTGKRFVVKETIEEIIRRIIEYKMSIIGISGQS
jgi:flagellar protein FlbD